MHTLKLLTVAIILLTTGYIANSYAEPAPRTISYQGYLKDAAGKPVSVSIPMVFSLYSSSGGQTPLWTEPQTVPVNNGIYTVTLGSTAPLDASAFSSQLYLGIRVGDDPAELQPRHTLTGVPYALQAGCAPGDGVECYTGPPATRTVTPCKPGKRLCAPGGAWGSCTDETLPQAETANGLDDDCDGVVDNVPCAQDADCSASQFCGNTQKCLTKQPNGATCSREAECAVHCTNGTCSDLLGCNSAAECGPATPCSSSTCNNHVCGTLFETAGTLVAAQTIGDCRSNQCNGSGAIVSVANDADLPASDGNDCTQDSCSNGVPTHLYSVAGSACSGGICDGAGSCVECLTGSNCPSGMCNQGSCVQASCADTVKNGAETDVDCGGPACAACSNSKACSSASDCQSGVCTGGVCQSPTCTDTVKNGSETAVDCGGPICAKCSTGLACATSSDCVSGNCTAGICTADLCSGVTCTPLDQCHTAGTCNPATGVCSNPAKADSTACDDGNACTQTDVCQAGVCSGLNPVLCAPQDQCHAAGTCNPVTGVCSSPNKANGTACNDGNACTQTDICQTGICSGSNPVTCAPQDQCHDAGTCNPVTGVCSSPNKTDGSSCDDGNPETTTEVCTAGICQ